MDDYPDMTRIKGEFGLVYILDNTIIPATISFFDIQKNKVKGPNGLLQDTKQVDQDYEMQLGIPGTIILRRFYDRNKHVFPLKNWKQLNLTLID